MEKYEKDALQAAKEIVVKFVEAGRVTPTNFSETFPAVYNVILETIQPFPQEREGSDAEAGEGFLLAEKMVSPFKR